MALKVLKTKFGRWLSGRNTDPEIDKLAREFSSQKVVRSADDKGPVSSILHSQTDQDLIEKPNTEEKQQQIELFNRAFNRMIDKLDAINENLNRQNDQNCRLINRIDKLPQLLDTIPSAVDNQRIVVESLVEQLKIKALKDQQFAEVVSKIPVETAKQSNVLNEMCRKLSVCAEADVQMTESLNKFNDTLVQLDEDTVSQTEGIVQMSRTFSESDKYLKFLLEKQQKRFTWVFVTAVIVSLLSISGLIFGIVIALNK